MYLHICIIIIVAAAVVVVIIFICKRPDSRIGKVLDDISSAWYVSWDRFKVRVAHSGYPSVNCQKLSAYGRIALVAIHARTRAPTRMRKADHLNTTPLAQGRKYRYPRVKILEV